jgi:hypothetical protein
VESSHDVFANVEVGVADDPFAGVEDWEGFGVHDGAPSEPVAVRQSADQPPSAEPEPEPVPASTPAPPPAPSDTRSLLARAEDAYQFKVRHGEPVVPELAAAHERYQLEQHEWQVIQPQSAGSQVPSLSIAAQEAIEHQALAQDEVPAPTAPVSAPQAPGAPASTEQVPQATASAPAPQSAAVLAPPDSPPAPGEPPQPPAALPQPALIATPVSAPESTPVPFGGEPPEIEIESDTSIKGRRYVILRVVGPDKFERLSWYEDSNGKFVGRSVAGARRHTIVFAHSNADALKKGYLALGAPEEGVHLVAVAAMHFQPRKVHPRAPVPAKTRLEISAS